MKYACGGEKCTGRIEPKKRRQNAVTETETWRLKRNIKIGQKQ
jgi:hypothetical protein